MHTTKPRHSNAALRTIAMALLGGFALASAIAPDPSQGTGSVAGKITAPKVSTVGPTSEKDLVVYLVPKKPQPVSVPSSPVVVAQKQLSFQPHVLAIVKGTKVVFRNDDPVTHNVLCKDKCGQADKDTEAKSQIEQSYTEAGVAAITCRLHPDMSMYVLVLETNHFKVVEIEKREVNGEKQYVAEYSLTGVPPGDYTLHVWNKRLTAFSRDLSIPAGGTQTVDVELSK